MFGILRKKLKESVKGLVDRAERPEEAAGKPEAPSSARGEKPAEAPPEKTEPAPGEELEEPVPEPSGGKRMRLSRLTRKITEKQFSSQEIDSFFGEMEPGLLQANLALEVLDFLREGLKRELAGKPVSRRDAHGLIQRAFESLLLETVDREKVSLDDVIRSARKEGRAACVLFLGFNGSGKTTTIAKVADRLMKGGHRPVLAAADTFRAASIEQLEFHGNRLGLKVVKHKYGSDPAAVVFDARKHAESRGLDVVLADSAGRMHTNVNLMDELEKIVRVNKPDLKILVVDSLTGNDVVNQVRQFDDKVGIDGLILTKMDVNEKGGSIISACHASSKPVLFMGTGQGYGDLVEFRPEDFVRNLLE